MIFSDTDLKTTGRARNSRSRRIQLKKEVDCLEKLPKKRDLAEMMGALRVFGYDVTACRTSAMWLSFRHHHDPGILSFSCPWLVHGKLVCRNRYVRQSTKYFIRFEPSKSLLPNFNPESFIQVALPGPARPGVIPCLNWPSPELPWSFHHLVFKTLGLSR
jgi:hypothetical protein